MWPEANIGLAAGGKSDLVVIDIDPRNGGTDSIKDLISEYGTLPHTVISHTGGNGFHFLYRYPTPTGIAKRVLANGVDLVSDGGYIVAPPSNHISGGEYRWASGHNPAKVALSDLPVWVLDRIQPPTYISSGGFDTGRFVPTGGRNSHFTRIAGSMRRWGLSQDAIMAALLIHNNEVCSPPMELREVNHIVGSVCRYEPEYHGEDEPQEGSSVRIEDCSLDEGTDGS
jgi:putative DNA primase/helicase